MTCTCAESVLLSKDKSDGPVRTLYLYGFLQAPFPRGEQPRQAAKAKAKADTSCSRGEQVHAPSQGSPQPDTPEHRLLVSPRESGSCLHAHRPAEPSCPLALSPNPSRTSVPHEEHTLTPVSRPADRLPLSPKPQGYLLACTEFSPFNFFNVLFTTSFQLFKKLFTYSVALGSFSTCILTASKRSFCTKRHLQAAALSLGPSARAFPQRGGRWWEALAALECAFSPACFY